MSMYRVDKKSFVVVVRLSFEVILKVEVINVVILSSWMQCKYTSLMKCMLFIVSHFSSLLALVVAHLAIVVLDDLLISLNCSWLSSWNSSCFKARLFAIVLFVILNWRLELTLWAEISDLIKESSSETIKESDREVDVMQSRACDSSWRFESRFRRREKLLTWSKKARVKQLKKAIAKLVCCNL